MEGVALSFVDDLNSAKDFWNIKVKIIRVWKQSFRWDMILIDEKGSKIQGIIKNHLVKDFAGQIKEDGVVVIKKFGVADQLDKHRVIDLDHKINFFKCIDVVPVATFSGHPYAFHFIPFTDILQRNVREMSIVDVIGRLASCGDLEIFKNKGKESKRINLDLEDLGGNVLRCTFWGTYAEQVNTFVAANEDTDLKLIIIQHGRVKEWSGVVAVQNDMFATRLFLNEELTEANDLRRRMIVRDGPATSVTNLSSQTSYPMRDEFLVHSPKKHVDELIEIQKEIACVVVGTIRMIEEDFGWFYKAHRTCYKKALTKAEYLEQAITIPDNFEEAPADSLWCLKCVCMAESLVPKFKVQFRVQDSSGSVSLVMFDKDISKIVGLTANDIMDRQISSNDMETFPHELSVLHNKLLAFKISVSKYNLSRKYYVYTVAKCCEDPEIIEALKDDVNPDEFSVEQTCADTVNLEDSSQIVVDSKDCASVTGSSKVQEIERDSATSPPDKRPIPFDLEEKVVEDTSTTRCIRKKLN